MKHFIRYLMERYLGARYVALIDHDGELNVRRVKFDGGMPYAWRMGLGVRKVWILDGGSTSGCGYVVGWKPVDHGAKRWPIPPREEAKEARG